MNGSVEFAVDHADRLVSIFAIDWPKRRYGHMIIILKHPPAKGERQSVFEPVDLILGCIIFDVHH